MGDVIFITNRRIEGASASDPHNYKGEPSAHLYTGSARIEASPISLAETAANTLLPSVARRIAEAERVYFFIHGFASTFAGALHTTAANRDKFAPDALAVVFTWPSAGVMFAAPPPADPELVVQDAKLRLFGLPGTAAYFADQKRARSYSTMAFLEALSLVREAFESRPREGRKLILMAHSMGNVVLQNAFNRYTTPTTRVFDDIFLCAGDAPSSHDAPLWIENARRIADRVHIYYSENDSVLRVSDVINGRSRLGFLGRCGLDKQRTEGVRFVDCSATIDLDRDPGEGNSGHFYYRRVPSVMRDIALAMDGGGEPGLTIIPGPPLHPLAGQGDAGSSA